MVKSGSSQMIPRFFLYSSILIDLFVGPELEADTVVTGFRAMLEGTDESWRLKLYVALSSHFNSLEYYRHLLNVDVNVKVMSIEDVARARRLGALLAALLFLNDQESRFVPMIMIKNHDYESCLV